MGQAFDISSHVLADDEPFFLTRDLRTRSFHITESCVGLSKFFLVPAIAENAVGVIQEIIAGSTLHRPRRRQVLLQVENLFDHQVNIAQLLA